MQNVAARNTAPALPSRQCRVPYGLPPGSTTILAITAGMLLVAFLAPDASALGWIEPAQLSAPLAFERNEGQAPGAVWYLARAQGYTVFLTAREAILAIGGAGGRRPEALRISVSEVQSSPELVVIDPLPRYVSYFLGSEPTCWQPRVPTYARVEYRSVLPGVDLAFHGSPRNLEIDFVLGAGVDARCIELKITGMKRLYLDAGGDLVFDLDGGRRETLRLQRPIAYQEVGGVRRGVPVRFALDARGRGVRFRVGDHDPKLPLVIDPVLSYSTYLGGTSSDEARGIAVDGAGNAYVVGVTTSIDFPVKDALQPTGNGSTAFISKFSPSGALLFSTYFGGTNPPLDVGYAIAVDLGGYVHVAGSTQSSDFPLKNAFQTRRSVGGSDAFVAKLEPDGAALVYSTLLGGDGSQEAFGLDVDVVGNAFVSGGTTSATFPIVDAMQPSFGGGADLFIVKLDPAGTPLFSTYFGGVGAEAPWGNGWGGNNLRVDAAGSVYLVGETDGVAFPLVNAAQTLYGGGPNDAFVAKLDPVGKTVAFATYLGGDGRDQAPGIAVDTTGVLWVAGTTSSTDLPLLTPIQSALRGGQDGFLVSYHSDGRLRTATYFGGSGSDAIHAIALDASGDVLVAGQTESADYPMASPIQGAFGGGLRDGTLSVFDPSASTLFFSTYLAGSSIDLAGGVGLDGSGNAYVVGKTQSTDFPAINAFQPALAGSGDALLLRIDCLRGGPVPGPVGNSFVAVRMPAGQAHFNWLDVAVASSYGVFTESNKSGPFATLAGTAPNGVVGLTLPLAPDTLTFYRVAGANCGMYGPK